MRTRSALGASLVIAVAAVMLAGRNPAGAAPPPRSRAEIEAVLSRSPGPPPIARQRPLRVVLLANEKDHGPNEHDYPLWQKRWAALLGGKAAGEEERTSLYGPPPAQPGSGADLEGLPGVSITRAWGWPAKDVLDATDLVVAFIGTGGRWNRERIADLDAFLTRGGGFVAIHSAVITSRELARDLAELLGLAWQDGTTTFRHGPLDLDVLALDHPICLGLPGRIRFEDETYWPLVGDRSKVSILATADEPLPPRPGGTRSPQPMMWTHERGKGRVFASILGHYTWTFDDPYFRILLLRGMAWAARESPFRFDPLVLRGARFEAESSTAAASKTRKKVAPVAPVPGDPRLLLWLDASDRSTLTVDPAGLVSDWLSRAPPERALSSREARRPRYVLEGVGRKPSVRFDGKDDVLRDTGFRRSAVDWTLFIAADIRSNEGGFRALFAANRTGEDDFQSGINLDLGGGPTLSFDVLNLEGIQHGGQSNLKAESSPFGAHVVSMVRAGGRARAYVDGAVEGERMSRDVPAALDEIRIGARTYGYPARLPFAESGFLDGDVAEVLLYGAALGEEERAGIEEHLLGKYGVAIVEVREPTIEDAFEKLPSHEAGKGRLALGPIDGAIAASHGSAEARRAIEDRLLAALRSAATHDARDFICRRLGVIGTMRSVPGLADLLTDERLSHPARVALERIAGPEAALALRAAVGKAMGSSRAGIVDSIGRLGDATAAPFLASLLEDGDPAVAAAAAGALGRLGAAEPLRDAAARGTGEAASAAAWALIDLGHRFLDENRKEEAVRSFRLLAGEGPDSIRIAALRGLALAAPSEAKPLLEDARQSGSPRLRSAAARILDGEAKKGE
ncbi:MAG TPA: ThuA domain-containing protein [Planctomycetota bacterium]|nr:ThuA domain-containing protein [Planctomycetota bacterium]